MGSAPVPLESPDFSALIELIREGTEAVANGEDENDDFRQYVYEAAMEAVYGPGFWAWRNAQPDMR